MDADVEKIECKWPAFAEYLVTEEIQDFCHSILKDGSAFRRYQSIRYGTLEKPENEEAEDEE